MINSIILNGLASYVNGTEIKPTKINYMFGGNGSGKTSFSRVISNPSAYNNCTLDWAYSPVQTYVFNRDFVKDNFDQSSDIPGIFTLGVDTVNAQKDIELAKTTIDTRNQRRTNLNGSLDNKRQELLDAEKAISERCWRLKTRYDRVFKPAFTGHMGSSKAFLQKFQAELNNSSELLDEATLSEKCSRIFSDNLRTYSQFSELNVSELIEKETCDLLTQTIVGKENIEIDLLIKKLNNSDWVKEGIGYLNEAGNVCPFCQQKVESDLKNKIESFFDETYQQKLENLREFKCNYTSYIEKIIVSIEAILSQDVEIVDFTKLKEKTKLLKEEYVNNVFRIDDKIKAPSKQITISSLQSTLDEIATIINHYITLIEENNRIVNNVNDERNKLKTQIWRFIISLEHEEYQSFEKKRDGYQNGIDSISRSIHETTKEIETLERLISEKELQITSVSHSVNLMNKILALYGYTNFRIEEAEKTGLYKIVRSDGTEARKTLSEGEYNFVAFLYFYNLVRGSLSKTGITSDRIVVIDDPISSLDSNALFIVSNLTKTIINGALKNNNKVVQVFVLTHNVYFYKEVTYKGSRETVSRDESFWFIQRNGSDSRIQKHDANPIQTTYELLWREITDITAMNRVTIFNTLRRILEYYFKILGGIDYEKLINNFEGEELLTCRSLVSWINDGSHFIQDDLVITVDLDGIQRYMNVFKLIFTKTGHGAHYDMMMARSGGAIHKLPKESTQLEPVVN